MDHPFPFPAGLFHSSAAARPPVAISACLYGEPVRYDATAKPLPTLPLLQAAVELLPLCPELEAGLGLPRPPVQLVAADPAVRVIGRDDPGLDVTAALSLHAATQARLLARRQPPLCGYVWKSRSPSCGVGSTPLWGQSNDSAALVQIGQRDGVQAAAVKQELPWLVMAEETALTTVTAVARFVVACSGVAMALDPSVDLIAVAASAPWGELGSKTAAELAAVANSGDRRRYAGALGAAVMAGRMPGVEQLVRRIAEARGETALR